MFGREEITQKVKTTLQVWERNKTTKKPPMKQTYLWNRNRLRHLLISLVSKDTKHTSSWDEHLPSEMDWIVVPGKQRLLFPRAPGVPIYSDVSLPSNIHHITWQFLTRNALSAHPCMVQFHQFSSTGQICSSISGSWATEFYIQYHTLPKLPFPNILCKVKSSIFNFIRRDGLSTLSSGSGRWPTFSISSKGDSQEIPWGSENGKSVVKRK